MPDVVRVIRATRDVTVRVQRTGDQVRVIRPDAKPVVQVSRQGPPGLPGRDGADGTDGKDGADGASAAHFEQVFSSADTTWDSTHNLGFTPAVTAMTLDRRVVIGSIALNTASRTVVQFYSPVAGILALS